MPCHTAQNLLRKVENLSNFAPCTTRRHSALLIYHFFLSLRFLLRRPLEKQNYTQACPPPPPPPPPLFHWRFLLEGFISLLKPLEDVSGGPHRLLPQRGGRSRGGDRRGEDRQGNVQRWVTSKWLFLKRTGESLFKGLLLFDVQKRVFSYIKPISPPSQHCFSALTHPPTLPYINNWVLLQLLLP